MFKCFFIVPGMFVIGISLFIDVGALVLFCEKASGAKIFGTILIILLSAISLWAYVMTALTEPGYVDRNAKYTPNTVINYPKQDSPLNSDDSIQA